MNPEFWAIIGVGVALAGLQWRLYAILNARIDRLETRMDRIEGWIAGRFREEPLPTA